MTGTSRVMGDYHARLCVQLRLVCSAGDSPAMAKVRRHVVRMAELRETDILKPIDTIIKRMITSCQAATKVNA